VMIQPLPTPTVDKLVTPGFHLRTVQTDQGERKYSLYVPEGYDGTRVFPVILFLHGAGERGQDGVTPAQTGIGPAIFNRPHGVPALVVFPQARQTWAAGSADSNAALKVLDDVMTSFATDPHRVILTGLSMGGHGSWDLAAAHPERFAAVVPICGGGKPADAAKLKALPVWSFCGDSDRDQTVLNMRTMVGALQKEGASPRITEYRGVGHQSWDRVYNDPDVIDWMLGQRKP
jgi:predicted peptidase